MGTLITYGSYIGKDNNLVNTVLSVTIADTVIAVLAGIVIFPAVFAFGIEPSEGPGLIFVTLPNVFHQMPGGYIFAILFFILLTVAALTSAISILEVVVAYFLEEFKMSRKASTILATILISLLGILCSLSMGDLSSIHISGLNIFDAIDWVSANIFLPVGGLFISIFVGWILGRKKVKKEMANGSTLPQIFFTAFIFLVKFISPLLIAIVLLNKVGLLRF